MTGFTKKLLFGLFLVFLLSLFPKKAWAKDYYFPKVSATYTIGSDGSINVVESRTYNFDGSFSFAYIDIPLSVERKGYRYTAAITNFQVTENGEPLPLSEVSRGQTFHARWDYSAFNQTKTFDISYTLTGAIGGGQNFDEFYWQVIGNAWDKRTEQAEFIVNFPATIPKDQVYAFAHGPLNGTFDFVSDNSVKFNVADVAPKQFVEVRLVFPKNIVVSTASSQKTLQQVLDEEKNFVSPAVYKRYLFYGLILLNVLWATYWIWAWFKYGREYNHNTPRYIHEPPSDLPPALVEVLLSQGNAVTTKSFIATLFDLANRKYLAIADRRVLKKRFLFGTSSEHEYAIIFKKSLSEIKSDKKLRKYEKMFLEKIAETLSVWTSDDTEAFGVKDESLAFKLSDLKKSFKQSTFRTFWLAFEKEIDKEADKLGFLEQGSESRGAWFYISLIILFVLHVVAVNTGILGFDKESTRVFVPYVIFVLIWLGAIYPKTRRFPFNFNFMNRWDRAWGKEARQWQAFKNFLDDIGHFEEKMPHDLVLWERFLVYGALFGLTAKILKLMPTILGEAATPSWYVGTGGNFSSFSDFSSGMNSFTSSVNSSFSTGSGGGFSGGGGGGGGAG